MEGVDIDEVIEWADALNILRIQKERMGVGIIPSVREYRDFFGITQERLEINALEQITSYLQKAEEDIQEVYLLENL